MLRAIFFDLDDTLCQTTATRPERARLSAESLLPHANGATLETLIARILQPDASGFPLGAEPLIGELDIAGTAAATRAAGIWYFLGCEHLIRCCEGAPDAIAALSATHSLGVISNGRPEVQRNKLAALGFERHFQPELVVYSEAVGYAKPDTRIFHHALASAGVEPSEALMIGDWAHGDVAAAQAVGMRGIWFNPTRLDLPAGITPDATITTLASLPSLLRSLPM